MSVDPLHADQPLDSRAIRRHFARAAATYDTAAVLQKEIGVRMAERLDVVRLAPTALLDAGCGTGEALGELAARYPQARRVALDVAPAMLAAARAKVARQSSLAARLLAPFRGVSAVGVHFVCADVGRLPFRAASFGLVWSNLVLQWANDLPRALAEFHRVLEVGGLLTFTTFGPDTLRELRAAFARADPAPHVNRFADMHDVGDLLVHAGFADPVLQMEYVTLTYAEPAAMVRDLKAIGATNALASRARGLMGRGRWRRAMEALEATRRDGRIAATFEVIHGHAWKAAPTHTADGRAIVRVERPARR